MISTVSSILSSYSSIIILLIGILSILYWIQKRKSIIPGPFAWPFVGHLVLYGKNPIMYLKKMAEKYGDVFEIRLGCQRFVCFNGYQTNKETINDMPNTFAGRPNSFTGREMFKDHIDFFGDWDDLVRRRRKALVKALSSTATTRAAYFQQVVEEATVKFISILKGKYNKSFIDPEKDLIQMMGHVMFHVLFGKLAPDAYDDKNYEVLFRINRFASEFSDSMIIDSFPWLEIFYRNYPFKWKKTLTLCKEFCSNQIKKHKDNTRDETDVNVIDILFNVDKNENIYPLQSIIGQMVSVIEGGVETLPNMALWFFLLIGSHPHIQERLFKHIKENVGEQLITKKDFNKLPFLEACVLETHRYATIAPIMYKATVEDVKYREFHIPKGTGILMNIWSINNDLKIWKEPDKFNPDRFFKNGEEHLDPVLTGKVYSFGAGRRRCVGESITRSTMLVILGTIFQHFQIQIDKKSVGDFTKNYNNIISLPIKYTMKSILR